MQIEPKNMDILTTMPVGRLVDSMAQELVDSVGAGLLHLYLEGFCASDIVEHTEHGAGRCTRILAGEREGF